MEFGLKLFIIIFLLTINFSIIKFYLFFSCSNHAVKQSIDNSNEFIRVSNLISIPTAKIIYSMSYQDTVTMNNKLCYNELYKHLIIIIIVVVSES